MRNCVVRSFAQGYTRTTDYLDKKLNDGWCVKFITPFIKNGNTEYVEYILEKE
jgi:hypothetical protein